MKHRYPVESLTESEATKARALAITHGADKAARMLGLCDARTLRRAACGEPVARLTVFTVRARLARTI